MVDTERLVNAAMKIIDPRVERIGISKIRTFNLRTFRQVKGPILIDAPGGGPPLAVIIPFADYMEVQKTMFGVEQMPSSRNPVLAIRTLGQRRLALALCCGMPPRVVCEVMGIGVADYYKRVRAILEATGMGSTVEFAVQQNAAVRRLMYGD